MIWVFRKRLRINGQQVGAGTPGSAEFNQHVLISKDNLGLPMSPPFVATIFGILGLIALRAIRNNIRSGTATSRGWTCTIYANPIRFCLIVSTRAAFVGLAFAEILHAFGLVGDPIANIKHALPFLL